MAVPAGGGGILDVNCVCNAAHLRSSSGTKVSGCAIVDVKITCGNNRAQASERDRSRVPRYSEHRRGETAAHKATASATSHLARSCRAVVALHGRNHHAPVDLAWVPVVVARPHASDVRGV